jgi:hypothetical protein
MEYQHDIICPECNRRHGPAAKSCECGYVFEEPEEEPAPARHYFLASLFFLIVAVVSAVIAQREGGVYLPIGGLLFASVTATFGVRSWLYFRFKKPKDSKKS